MTDGGPFDSVLAKLKSGDPMDMVIIGDGGHEGPVSWIVNAFVPGFVRCDACRIEYQLASGEWPTVPDLRACAHVNDALKGIQQ